jgi:arginine decarboxylase
MNIEIAGATGTGPTDLAAFDNALVAIGAGNYNLIRLSSMIPPGATVRRVDRVDPGGGWGDRLYVVYADQRTVTRNAEAWAGIGWVQDRATGAGMLAEHGGQSEGEVRKDISDSLATMLADRGMPPAEPDMCIVGGMCDGTAICALAVAIFRSEPWV